MHLSLGDKQTLVQALWTGWNDGGAALEQFPKTVKAILDTNAWEDREVDGKPMHNNTFREFIISPPLKGCGWGKQIDAIEKLLGLKAPNVLKDWREAITQQGARTDLHNIVMEVKHQQGNSLAYTLARLSRDHSKLYDRVIAGELSANAAAIEAGFRKKRRCPHCGGEL
jgi:hypothetical protein